MGSLGLDIWLFRCKVLLLYFYLQDVISQLLAATSNVYQRASYDRDSAEWQHRKKEFLCSCIIVNGSIYGDAYGACAANGYKFVCHRLSSF